VTLLAEFLDGIEFRDLGGTCYTINPYLTELLRELGYDVELLGADMSQANVHTCIRVHVDGVAYHVDAGFAAPFREPVRLDTLPAAVKEGDNRYLFSRDANGGVRLDMISDTEMAAKYLAHDPPRTREFFDPVAMESYSPNATFMQRLRISRIFEGHSVDLIGRRLYRHEAGRTAVVELASMGELKAAVAGPLGMPRCPVEEAIAVLERVTGAAFFPGGR
jgi:arylamine N-acetyltransferase